MYTENIRYLAENYIHNLYVFYYVYYYYEKTEDLRNLLVDRFKSSLIVGLKTGIAFVKSFI
ncbi:hypothetical protein ME9_00846 [Bartonella taylorii 8TBB]|uniref:Uncharacterized protein n=1 Tax=Bartonella taylorii 8TBB TaxID=1094560 RepID=A0A9P2RZY2_BARTA|nr:hypothetical protein ME9_00846 [Bartonella taylorii 8TBB]